MSSVSCGEAVLRIMAASTPDDIASIFRELGLPSWCWVERKKDTVRLLDAMPVGFFEVYFGKNIDLFCPVSWALRRQRWSTFCMEEAFIAYERAGEDLLAQHFKEFLEDSGTDDLDLDDVWDGSVLRLWESFGIKDAVLIATNSAAIDAFTVFAGQANCRDILEEYRQAILLAGNQLNQMLAVDSSLPEFPRKFFKLTRRQEQVLQMQLDHPEWSHADQAAALGMSLPTLKDHHKKIANNFGVSHFAGATVRAIQSGIFAPKRSAG